MKKIAIIYGGKTGTTKKCAGILKSLIPEAFVFSVNEDFKLDDYDVLVLDHPYAWDMIKASESQLKETIILKTKNSLYVCRLA